uniref:Uncharacterized protein n=1 Tax=Meloidogyne enterolobii TaxID=390850 RepID=A0A6V7UNZ8_MELEN|nr:unnamed protein product [Meloidogyne enterolobii]
MNDTKNGWIGLVFDKNQDCKNYKMNIVLGEFKDKNSYKINALFFQKYAEQRVSLGLKLSCIK